jgi:hypothetical protein
LLELALTLTSIDVGLPAGGGAQELGEHVGVNLHFERGGVCSPLHHPGKSAGDECSTMNPNMIAPLGRTSCRS